MLENIRRWQWIVISILVGLLVGFVRAEFGEPATTPQSIFPNVMEKAVRESDKIVGGITQPRFHSIRVVRMQIPDTKYVLWGKLINEQASRGQELVYDERICVTDLQFKPRLPIRGGKEYEPNWVDKLQGWAEKMKLKEPDPPGTVLDWLRKAQANEGVVFKYEWWRQPRVSMAMWGTASFIVIGLVWPTIINLIVFGSMFRPRGESGMWGLRKVRARAAAVAHKPGLTEAELERIRAMGDALEADLMARAGPGDHSPAPENAPAPVKPLTPEPVATSKVPSAPSSKAIGMDQDDFYPTEVHAKPPEER